MASSSLPQPLLLDPASAGTGVGRASGAAGGVVPHAGGGAVGGAPIVAHTTQAAMPAQGSSLASYAALGAQ